MSSRIAAAVLALLTLAVVGGWLAVPDTDATYATAETVAYYPDAGGGSVPPAALLVGFMISGAALIGLFFFRPNTPKGPRVSETLSATVEFVLLVDRATGRVLRNLHQELEVVLGLLQTVDQQIDRLMRIQAGQYAAQLVQHGRLVRAEQ